MLLRPGLLVIISPSENRQMGFICAQVSLQYGDGMWLQLSLGLGQFKVFASSPLFLQKADKTRLWRKKTTKHDALQRKDAYCSDKSSMKNSVRTLAHGFISLFIFSCCEIS